MFLRGREARRLDGDGGGRVVGFVAFQRPYISWLYVNPRYYRRGIGRELLR